MICTTCGAEVEANKRCNACGKRESMPIYGFAQPDVLSAIEAKKMMGISMLEDAKRSGTSEDAKADQEKRRRYEKGVTIMLYAVAVLCGIVAVIAMYSCVA